MMFIFLASLTCALSAERAAERVDSAQDNASEIADCRIIPKPPKK